MMLRQIGMYGTVIIIGYGAGITGRNSDEGLFAQGAVL